MRLVKNEEFIGKMWSKLKTNHGQTSYFDGKEARKRNKSTDKFTTPEMKQYTNTHANMFGNLTILKRQYIFLFIMKTHYSRVFSFFEFSSYVLNCFCFPYVPPNKQINTVFFYKKKITIKNIF